MALQTAATRTAGQADAAVRRRTFTLATGDGHHLHVVDWGDEHGMPVVALHGGPGGASNPSMLQPFDAQRHRVIMIDQRGSGRSTPAGRLARNRSSHLVDDIERVRRHLGIARWSVFGGSWGATLALAYVGAHSHVVDRVLLRGAFLSSGPEIRGLLLRTRQRAPQVWARLYRASGADCSAGLLPALTRGLVLGQQRRGRDTRARKLAEAYRELEMVLLMRAARMPLRRIRRLALPAARLMVARYAVQAHYLRQDCWLGKPRVLAMAHIAGEAGLPGEIVHGRRDPVCPPGNVLDLQRVWSGLRAQIVAAGHLGSEPAIRRALAECVRGWV
jgi:proline iminopeptidase